MRENETPSVVPFQVARTDFGTEGVGDVRVSSAIEWVKWGSAHVGAVRTPTGELQHSDQRPIRRNRARLPRLASALCRPPAIRDLVFAIRGARIARRSNRLLADAVVEASPCRPAADTPSRAT